MDGMSAYGSYEEALVVWQGIHASYATRGKKMQIGNYIAEVRLMPDMGFRIEDIGDQTGHVTIFGLPKDLAAAVADIKRGQPATE